MTFALATIRHHGTVCPALRLNGRFWLLPMAAETLGLHVPAALIDVFKDWTCSYPKIREIGAAAASGRLPADLSVAEDDVELMLPLQYPRKVFCTGANYADHLEEMGVSMPKDLENGPFFYMKPASSSLAGPGKNVHIPDGCNNFDWEAEMVVVFGRGGRNIPAEKAMDYIAAYTMGIDFTARDQFQVPPPFMFDFTLGKCQDRTTPIGPVLVPKEFVNGENLRFWLDVNGARKQSTTTAHMTYSLAEQIAGISRRVEIEPGDIMFTGSPAGVGAARGESLRVGDSVVVAADVIGSMEVVIQPPLKHHAALA